MQITAWRVLFFLTAVFILTGGPQHPGGNMEQMLANPKWVPAHLLVLAGFVSLFGGLIAFVRVSGLPARTVRWTKIAIAGTALQAIEMVFHTAAVVDLDHLQAGHATPVLTTHLAMSKIFYPAFGVTMVLFILATMRDRSLGSRWIGWLGILGAVCHGAAPPAVLIFQQDWLRLLFPMVMFFALWCLLVAVWPVRQPEKGPQQVAKTAFDAA